MRTLVLYERVGHEGRRPSPFSWRTRYALTHKGVTVEYRATRFADVQAIEHLSGQPLVPVLVDGPRVIHDSWNIALYLEEQFPERASLFGSPSAIGAARLINVWSDLTLNPLVRRLIYADFIWCLDAGDRHYFRSSRERDLGCSLEEACADRPKWCAAFEGAIAPLERTLTDQPHLGGAAPAYVDYVVFSVFQWARLGSAQDILRHGDRGSCMARAHDRFVRRSRGQISGLSIGTQWSGRSVSVRRAFMPHDQIPIRF